MSKGPKTDAAQKRMAGNTLDTLAGSLSARKTPPPTAVGFGDVNASATKKKAANITISATGRIRYSVPQS